MTLPGYEKAGRVFQAIRVAIKKPALLAGDHPETLEHPDRYYRIRLGRNLVVPLGVARDASRSSLGTPQRPA